MMGFMESLWHGGDWLPAFSHDPSVTVVRCLWLILLGVVNSSLMGSAPPRSSSAAFSLSAAYTHPKLIRFYRCGKLFCRLHRTQSVCVCSVFCVSPYKDSFNLLHLCCVWIQFSFNDMLTIFLAVTMSQGIKKGNRIQGKQLVGQNPEGG